MTHPHEQGADHRRDWLEKTLNDDDDDDDDDHAVRLSNGIEGNSARSASVESLKAKASGSSNDP